MKPSWEVQIDTIFINIKTDLLKYFKTSDFAVEWSYWDMVEGGAPPDFCHSIQTCLGTYDIKFPIQTPTLSIILRVIEHSLYAQFNLIHTIIPKALFEDTNYFEELCKKCVEESFNRLEPHRLPSLQDALYEEYKVLWNAAEKIQIMWRKAISNPEYRLCKKITNKIHNSTA